VPGLDELMFTRNARAAVVAITPSPLQPKDPTVFSGHRKCITSRAVMLIAASAYLVFAAASTASAEGSLEPTCQAGQTLFASGPVRAFEVTDRNENQEAFVCVSSSAKPIVIDDPGPAIEVDVSDFHIRGARLGIEIDDMGLGAGGGTDLVLGWIDLQTGEVALDALNAGGDSSRTLLPASLISYAFAPDGTMAVIAGTNCEVVAVLPLRAKPFADVYRLGPPRIVFTAPRGRLVHWSIAITATTVRWRTLNGTERSARWLGGSSTTTSPTGAC
jgi:hypothetical protein